MAFSASARLLTLYRIPRNSCSLPQTTTPISLRLSSANLSRRKFSSIRLGKLNFLCAKKYPILLSSLFPAEAPPVGGIAPAISLTDNALKHLNRMRAEKNEDLCLRIGVRQGGCSGMSYTMEFEQRANARPDDSIIEYNGFIIGSFPCGLVFLSCLVMKEVVRSWQ
ncbi:FeS cluster biogenesis [Dillenia turbinata]|uniref:FeS cluster biogenesis n=1 Tax=Dillenia turbinata TaxID=194707 RepID=A0AAN8V7Y5_9MAGN